MYKNHHFWKNIGYNAMSAAPATITNWVTSAAQSTESISKSALHDCRVKLQPDQLKATSKLITLDYLANAVKGQFYQKQGVSLTHYRLMALESLEYNKK